MKLTVNGREQDVDVAPEMPLLWVLRDTLGLTGTKFGCGMSQCGVCTVHVDGKAVRSCTTMMSSVEGKSVTTIEGLAADPGHPVLRAWHELDVVQCGWCQPGQVMGAAALVAKNASPTDAEIVSGMNGHLCRCGTYARILAGVRRAAEIGRTK